MTPNYRKLWIEAEGADYRKSTYDRQSEHGTKPLTSNPTIDEIRMVLRGCYAKTVLEVGCGWGRLLEPLADEFMVEGCDISKEMLAHVPKHIKTFEFDITFPNTYPRGAKYGIVYDVAFTRGVLHYLLPDLVLVERAVSNLMELAKKVVLWEYVEVCDAIARVNPRHGFDFRPIKRVQE